MTDHRDLRPEEGIVSKTVVHVLGGETCRELTQAGPCGASGTDGLCAPHREDRSLYLTDTKAYVDRIDRRAQR